MEYIIGSRSAADTENAGRELAVKLCSERAGKKWFICLFGDLGAGKTAFVRGFASEVSPGSRVKSPSYTVVNEYRMGDIPLFHFDLYRLEDSEDSLFGIGFDDYLSGGHCIIEWSEYLPENLRPDDAVTVKIEKCGEECRKITVEM